MSYVADRVRDTSTTTGTGALTLANTAPTGFVTFATAFGAVSSTVSYCIDGGSTGEWEVGLGTFNGTAGLIRDTVLASSNSGSLVNFSSGTKAVFSTMAAALLTQTLVGAQLAQVRGWALS